MRTSLPVASGIIAIAVVVAAGCGPPAQDSSNESPPAAVTSPADDAARESPPAGAEADPVQRTRFIQMVRGKANVGYLPPETKVEGNMVVTTFKVKNLSSRAIAGLKIEEFWRDKAGTLVGGSSEQLRQPLMPGDTATIVLRTPRSPAMYRNQYRFRHAYGAVEVEQVQTLEE
jgi:hypothetical protein